MPRKVAKAVRCPVCGGSGRVWDTHVDPGLTAVRAGFRTCHGCGGKGWVTVYDEEECS